MGKGGYEVFLRSILIPLTMRPHVGFIYDTCIHSNDVNSDERFQSFYDTKMKHVLYCIFLD